MQIDCLMAVKEETWFLAIFLALVAHISIWMLPCLSVCTCVSAEDALMFKTVSSGKIIRAQQSAAGTVTHHKLTVRTRARHHPVPPFAWFTTLVCCLPRYRWTQMSLREVWMKNKGGAQTLRHVLWASGLWVYGPSSGFVNKHQTTAALLLLHQREYFSMCV